MGHALLLHELAQAEEVRAIAMDDPGPGLLADQPAEIDDPEPAHEPDLPDRLESDDGMPGGVRHEPPADLAADLLGGGMRDEHPVGGHQHR
jgi:hypothetical protein